MNYIKSLNIILMSIIVAIFGLTAITNCNIFFSILMIIWIFIMYYALRKIQDRIFLFLFNSMFFIFLMGRDIQIEYLYYMKERHFSNAVTTGVYIEEIISLVVILLTYMAIEYFKEPKKNVIPKDNIIEKNNEDSVLNKVARYIFFIMIIGAIAYQIIFILYVMKVGYTKSYAKGLNYEIPLNYFLQKIDIAMPTSFAFLLATMPKKKDFALPLKLYLLYLVLTVFTGQRSPFMLGCLLVLFYFVLRNKLEGEDSWIKRKYIFIGIAMMPFMLIFLYFYNYVRFGVDVNYNQFSIFKALGGFFWDQGVTGKVVKYAREYNVELQMDQFYTGIFLKRGFLAHLFDMKVYHNNTIIRALYSGDYPHALSYKVLGKDYLEGRGTGTSYIAELYQDFSYMGIVLGSMIYGIIFYVIDKCEKINNVFCLSFVFMIIPHLLWAPRGPYTGFINKIISPTTVLILIMIYFIKEVIVYIKNKKNCNLS